MKMIAKLAACGLLSLSLSAMAQAPAVKLSENAVKMIESSPTGKEFLTKTVGLRAGSSSEALIKAIQNLPAGASAIALEKVQAYLKQATDASSNTAKTLNESAAQAVFTKNGQLLQVAQLQEIAASRAGSDKAACSSIVDASKMAEGTKVSYADVKAAIDAGNIVRGTCTEIMETWNKQARENVDETGVCMTNNKAPKALGAARTQIAQNCFEQALDNDGVDVSPEVAAQKLNAVTQKCNIFRLQ